MNFGFECFKKLFCCFPKVYGWGQNDSGQLGVEGSSRPDFPLVGTAPPTIEKQGDWLKVAVSADGGRGFGILSDGSLWEWGGQVGSSPTLVGGEHKWEDVSASSGHEIAIREDGTLWGRGSAAVGLTEPPYLDDRAETIRAILSRPIASAEPTGLRGKYSERPTAIVKQMSRQSNQWPNDRNWTEDSVVEPAVAEAVMNYSITSVEVTNGGSGYSSPPRVTLEEDGLSLGPAERNLAVSAVVVRERGSGYKSPPRVVFSGLNTSEATATVTEMYCKVASVTITNGGSGYSYASDVRYIMPDGREGHVGYSVLSPSGAVVGVTPASSLARTMPGSYPLIFRTSGGATATGFVTLEGDQVQTVSVTRGGEGYKDPPSVSFEPTNGGSGATAEASTVSLDSVGSGNAVLTANMRYGIVAINVTNGGSGYTTRPSVITPGSGYGSQATATVSRMGSIIQGISVTHPGGGYSFPPTVTVNGRPLAGLTAILTNGFVSSVQVEPGLKVDAESAQIRFTGGGGSGASATASLVLNHVLEVTVGTPGLYGGQGGSGYPITFSGPGSGATATATFGNGYVHSVTVNSSASPARYDGYKEKPKIVFSGGGGSGAEAAAKSEGVVESVVIKSPGNGYTTARFSHSTSDGELRRSPFVVFSRDPSDEFQDSPTLSYLDGIGLGVPSNAAAFVCKIEPGPVQSLTLGPNASQVAFPKQTFGRVKSGTVLGYYPAGEYQVSLVVGGRSETIAADESGTVTVTSNSDGWPCRPWIVVTGTVQPTDSPPYTYIAATGNVFPTCAPWEQAFPPFPAQSPNPSVVKQAVGIGGIGIFGNYWTSASVSFSESDAEVEAKIVDGGLYAVQRKVGIRENPPPGTPAPQVTISGQVAPHIKKWVAGRVPASGWDGPPIESVMYNLQFLSHSGADAAGTATASPEGVIQQPVLTDGGYGYSSEPIVKIESFRQRWRQVGTDTWKSVAAGQGGYSLAIKSDGRVYWWGSVPGLSDAILKPSPVGKRVYITATPAMGDDSCPVSPERIFISPPAYEGIHAAVASCNRQEKSRGSSAVSSDGAGFREFSGDYFANIKYEGDYEISVTGGCGYIELPEVYFEPRGEPVLSASASLVGPDSCEQVVAVGSRAMAIDAAGVAWHLNATAAVHGSRLPNKNRNTAATSGDYSLTYQKVSSASWPFAAIARTPAIPAYTKTLNIIEAPGDHFDGPQGTSGVFVLKSGGSGYTRQAKLRYSGQKFAWRIIERTETYTKIDCAGTGFNNHPTLQSVSVQTSVHSSGEFAAPAWEGLGGPWGANYLVGVPDSPNEPLASLRGFDTWCGSVVPHTFYPHNDTAYGGFNLHSWTAGHVPPIPPSTDVTEGLVQTKKGYTREVFPLSYGTLEVVDTAGSGAVYELVPSQLRHGGVGPAKIGGAEPWAEITQAGFARQEAGGLFYGFESAGHLDIPPPRFPESQQIEQLRIGGACGVREQDQSLWLLGHPTFGPPVSKGDVELKIENAGERYTEPAILKFSEQPDGVAVAEASLDGAVVSVGITNKGSGYRTVPTVSISGGASCQAAIAGPVESVAVTQGGSGYRVAPKVVFSQPGISAVAESRIVDGKVTAVSVSEGGRYRAAPSVTFEPVPDIESLELGSGGSGYSLPPSVLITGGSGSGAAATCTIDGKVVSVRTDFGGANYSEPPKVFFSGGHKAGNGSVVYIKLDTPGFGYTSAPAVSFAGGGGSGASASATIDQFTGEVLGVTISGRGSGYTLPPTVFLTGGGGTGASATAFIGPPSPATATAAIDPTTGAVSAVSVGSQGGGYQHAPAVRFDVHPGKPGGGASATAFIAGPVEDMKITSRGSGYYRPPQVFFQGGGGTGAAATATTAAVGSGAAATCKINGSVIYCNVTSGGSGYSTPPDITFSGGGNEAIQSLQEQLSAGEITEEEFSESVKPYRAAAQARIQGNTSLSIESGGSGYAYRLDPALVGPYDPLTGMPPLGLWYPRIPPGQTWGNNIPYFRDGDMIQSRYWIHHAEGRVDQVVFDPYGGHLSGMLYAPDLARFADLKQRIANVNVFDTPGGPIDSLTSPPGVPPIEVPTWFRQKPLVSFWNTHVIRSSTSLRVDAVGKKTGVPPQPVSINSWAKSMQELNSLLESSRAELGDQIGDLTTRLYQARGEGFLPEGARELVFQFLSGGTITGAFFDGINLGLSQPVSAYKFSVPPTVKVECDVGSGASLSVAVGSDGYGSALVGSGGAGYGSLARAVVSGGRPLITPASASSTVVNGAVTSVSVSSQGGGYTSTPTVVLHGGGGSGATAVAVMGYEEQTTLRRKVVSVTVTSPGSGYTSPPAVSFVETDKDYADFYDGNKSQYVRIENATHEYFELPAGEKSRRIALTSIPPFGVTRSSYGADENLEPDPNKPFTRVELFFDDGFVTEATLDASHSHPTFVQGDRHPANLKRLPPGVAVQVFGKCLSPVSVSVIRPKWSNEMHGWATHDRFSAPQSQPSVTLAVRDTTQ